MESESVALMTWGFDNHAVRTKDWRYIRYEKGGEELYDENADPKEWTNLANKPGFAAVKARLATFFPAKNVPPGPVTPSDQRIPETP